MKDIVCPYCGVASKNILILSVSATKDNIAKINVDVKCGNCLKTFEFSMEFKAFLDWVKENLGLV